VERRREGGWKGVPRGFDGPSTLSIPFHLSDWFQKLQPKRKPLDERRKKYLNFLFFFTYEVPSLFP
jgi:hypothetical protein